MLHSRIVHNWLHSPDISIVKPSHILIRQILLDLLEKNWKQIIWLVNCDERLRMIYFQRFILIFAYAHAVDYPDILFQLTKHNTNIDLLSIKKKSEYSDGTMKVEPQVMSV